MDRFIINEKGFWETENDVGHVYDSSLCTNLINFLNKNNVKSLVDFGCGLGDYIYAIKESGVYCEGYDGNPNTKILTKGLCSVLDLSVPFKLDNKFDCVLSLEVGEHIPKEYEQVFIDNICNHSSDWIILSWAIIGQFGDGHINCQNNEYIISQIESRGFVYDIDSSFMLRNRVTVAPWLKDTILLFKKK